MQKEFHLIRHVYTHAYKQLEKCGNINFFFSESSRLQVCCGGLFVINHHVKLALFMLAYSNIVLSERLTSNILHQTVDMYCWYAASRNLHHRELLMVVRFYVFVCSAGRQDTTKDPFIQTWISRRKVSGFAVIMD